MDGCSAKSLDGAPGKAEREVKLDGQPRREDAGDEGECEGGRKVDADRSEPARARCVWHDASAGAVRSGECRVSSNGAAEEASGDEHGDAE